MVHPSAHRFSTFPLLPSAYPGLVPSGCWNETFSDPGIELGSPTLQADSLPSEPPGKHVYYTLLNYEENKGEFSPFNVS